MERIEKNGEAAVYKKDNGEMAAWLTDFGEKMELGHEGKPKFKKAFYIFVLIGFLYLGIIFLFF